MHDRGALVLLGGCTDPPLRPYQPLAEAFEDLGEADLFSRVPSEARAPVEAEAARFAFYVAVTAALRAATRERPVLVLLEDLHWAAESTTALLQHLIRSLVDAPLCLLVTYRSTPADCSPAFRSAIGDLARLSGVTRVQLRGFDTAELREFVAGASGESLHRGLEPVVEQLVAQTDGNPLMVGEFWRYLVENGHLVRPPDGRWRVERPLAEAGTPAVIQDLVGARLARLPGLCQELLALGAVIGPTFAVPALAAVSGVEPATVLEALDPAVGCGLVDEAGAGYRFSHALLARTVHDGLPRSLRAAAHAAVAQHLKDCGGEAAEIAHHLLAALPLVEPAEAVAAARAAARAAGVRIAHEEAVAMLTAALPLTEDPPTRGALLLELATAATSAGDVGEAQTHCLAAVSLARRCDDDGLLVAAALALSEANWRSSGGRDVVTQVLNDALARTDAGSPDHVRLTAALGRTLALSGLTVQAHDLIGRALSEADRIGDLDGQVSALSARVFVSWLPHTLDEQCAAARDLFALGQQHRRTDWTMVGLDKSMFGAITVGDLEEVRRHLPQHAQLADRSGQPFWRVLDRQLNAVVALGEGRFAEAEALVESTADLARFLPDDATSGGGGVLMFGIRREQGRLAEARPVLEAVAAGGQAGQTWRPALCVLYAELGMLDEARRELTATVADDLAAVPRDSLWSGTLSYLADAAMITRDAAAAEPVSRHLSAYQGLVIQMGHFLGAYGAADRYLGSLAELLGDARRAEQHFETAARVDGRARMPVWSARTALAFGRFLAARPEAAARERAVALLGQASGHAARLGLGSVHVAATAAADGLRADRRRDPEAARAGLTERELGILALLVHGLSNRQIGAELHISQHTAANHVRAILLKTGCANRTEVAGWALRNGLVGS